MADLDLRYVPIDALEPDPENPKAHDVDEIADAIVRFGFIDPALHDGRTGRLIAGHGRRSALLALRDSAEEAPSGIRVGDTGEWLVPVVVGWESASDDEARAALVALNETTIRGGYDEPALLAILERLAETDGGFAGTGYDEQAYDELRARLGEYAPTFDPVDPDGQGRLDQRNPIVCGACGTHVDPATGDPVDA